MRNANAPIRPRDLASEIEAVLAELRRLGSEVNRAGQARFGINTERALGVSIASLRPIARRLKGDHELAGRRLPLHLEDGSHPTPLGSYLAACVFYAVLYGRDPTGLEMLDVDAGTGDPATSIAVRLEAEEAHFLQRMAWAATAG